MRFWYLFSLLLCTECVCTCFSLPFSTVMISCIFSNWYGGILRICSFLSKEVTCPDWDLNLGTWQKVLCHYYYMLLTCILSLGGNSLPQEHPCGSQTYHVHLHPSPLEGSSIADANGRFPETLLLFDQFLWYIRSNFSRGTPCKEGNFSMSASGQLKGAMYFICSLLYTLTYSKPLD